MTLSPAAALAIYCLALNAYHEARGEGRAEMVAVSHVVLNRVDDSRFPDTVCKVVWEKRWSPRHRRWVPQFSWTLDGRSDKPKDPGKWQEAQLAAVEAWFGQDTIHGAVFYFNPEKVWPDWANSKTPVKWMKHLFMTYPDKQRP